MSRVSNLLLEVNGQPRSKLRATPSGLSSGKRRILQAAMALYDENGQKPFLQEELIVAAYKLDQNAFGLAGFEDEYCDSHRVMSLVCGKKGLAGSAGLLQRVGRGRYTITREGMREAAAADVAQIARCRVCGCTDDDCRQCIAKTGEPCTWVEPDLCSACAEEEDTKLEREMGKA